MYAKFGGLGIHNCLLHTRVVKMRAETKNINELLAYRTIATTEQALALMVRHRLRLATDRLRLSAYQPMIIMHQYDGLELDFRATCKLLSPQIRGNNQFCFSSAVINCLFLFVLILLV